MENHTKDRILSAAAFLFTEHGFSGTAIRDIAKQACINQSQIYHHIGNKEMLWQAVKTYLLKDQQTVFPLDHYETLMDFLIDLTSKYVEIKESNSLLDRLLQWQSLEKLSTSSCDSLHSPLARYWIKPILALQSQNQITNHYSADFISTFIFGALSGLPCTVSFSNAKAPSSLNRQQFIIMTVECLFTALTKRK